MKTLFIQIILYGSLLFCVFTLGNCKDDCKEEKIYIQDFYGQVPYLGTDTLRFLRNNADTQVFIGQGLERYFIPQEIKGECTKHYEAVRIRFKNVVDNNDLVLECYYDFKFYERVLRFFYKETDFGPLSDNLQNNFMVNGQVYHYIGLYTNSKDTLSYLAYTRFNNNGYRGFLKIKYPGDTLTIIR